MIVKLDKQQVSFNKIFRILEAGNVCVLKTNDQLDFHSWLEAQLRIKVIPFDVDGLRPEPSSAFVSPGVIGCYLTPPPLIVGLFYTGGEGCECSFVSARKLWKALTARFSEKEILPLFDSDAMSMTIQSKSFSGPVFVKKEGEGPLRVACNFTSRLDWRATPSGMARPAFDFCREFILQCNNQSTYRLEEGEYALIPNLLVMFGKKEMSDNGGINYVCFNNVPAVDFDLDAFVPQGVTSNTKLFRKELVDQFD